VYAILHKTERNEDMVEKLTGTQIETLLRNVDGWAKVKDREAIYKHFQFPDFVSAFSWMTRVAMVAEKMDHHPEWFNVYDRVEVTLATHEVEGLSQRDFELARLMDAA
jgi:4a-hydroxytetrahydrobiopterin dehydratase